MSQQELDTKVRRRNRFLATAEKKHGNKFDYSHIPMVIPDDKVISLRCKEHGKFTTTTAKHISSRHGGCTECRRTAFAAARGGSKEAFIERATKIHGDKFDYSKVVYKNAHTPITITCPDHGRFQQAPRVHVKGSGCPECGKLATVANNDSPMGWTHTAWREAGECSDRFDSFKLYIIFCNDFHTGEMFIKIGKTFHTTKQRFTSSLPYEYVVLFEYKGSAKMVSRMENRLHKHLKMYSYTPLKEFGGRTECFHPTLDLVQTLPLVFNQLLMEE